MARRRNRQPVSNALLKWQLQQDRRRLTEAQERLMRLTAPSPSHSFDSLDAWQQNQPTAYRTRAMQCNDPEDALKDLIMEREQREASTPNRQKPSRIPVPSALPPLRRPGEPARPPRPSNNQTVQLRPTGQQLNAVGDFFSPVRPRDPAMSSSGAGLSTRVNLAISRIKAPSLGGNAPSPRTPLRYDQMKTPERWRSTAMRSNQDELNSSALRRWEEEDAAQADRLLEKAAREGDTETLWNDLFYGTKAARAKNNQSSPDKPVVYSTSSFPEVYSQPMDKPLGSSCYENYKGGSYSPLKTDAAEKDLLASELSTAPTSEQTKPSTSQQSDAELLATNSSVRPPWKSVSQMLTSLTQTLDADEDFVAGDDRNHEGAGGDDKEHFSGAESPTVDREIARVEVFPGVVVPQWSVIIVACCLVVGTSGFFMEELMGLFFTSSLFALSRAEQERMHERINVIQQELQGFQLSTSDIDVRSQKVLEELQQYMDRMRLDREKHQDMLANEMQELRRYILRTTYELVEKEREMIDARVKEIVDINIINEEQNDGDHAVIGIVEESKSTPEENAPELLSPIQSEIVELVQKDEQDTVISELPSVMVYTDDKSYQEGHIHAEVGQENITVPIQPGVKEIAPFMQPPDTNSDAHIHADLQNADEGEKAQVSGPSQQMTEEIGYELDSLSKLDQAVAEELAVEHQQEIVTSSEPEIEEISYINNVVVDPVSVAAIIAKPQQGKTSMLLEVKLLLIAVMFLAACVALRVWNIHRRKRWFEQRRKRRNQRALLLAQQRARAVAEYQNDSEWEGGEEDTSVETVSLMTPPRDSEAEDANQSEQLHHSSDIDTDSRNYDVDDLNLHEPRMRSPEPKATVYRSTTSERSSRSRNNHSRPVLLRRRSPQFERERKR